MTSILPAIREALPDDALRAHMAERRALHAGAAGGIDPAAILTLESLEDALVRGAVPVEQIRVFGGYKQLNLERAGIVRGGKVQPLVLRALARQGATLVVNNIQKLSPALWDLACDAERWFGTTATLAAVASFGQSGIELHYDYNDLIVVQLEGTKQWSFYGEPLRESGRRFCVHDGDVPTQVTAEAMMAPGDVMYIPSGLFHQCTPGPYSLHLGLLVIHPSGGDYAGHLAELARAEETQSSEPLQAFLGSQTVAAQAEAIKRRMIARIEAADPLEWLAARQAAHGHVRGFGLREGADGGTAVLNVTMGPDHGADGKLRAAGVAVNWTPEAQAIVDRLRDGPCPVADLPDAAALAKLVDAGLVRIIG
ncbi:MAG: cupin domain-containing protein [Pseudomonadota bacterium]